jgi:hypothetical protein
MAYPLITLLTTFVSVVDDSVNAGAATVTLGFDEEEAAESNVDGGTYAGVVTGIEAMEIGDVPSAVVAETVKVYLVEGRKEFITTLRLFKE